MKNIKESKIISVEPFGIGNTIDLEVDHPDHNFYAEGIVVSNSHSFSYAILSARTTYIKQKYPLQFFLALLKLSKFEPDSHAEISEIAKELPLFGIELLPPDLAKSDIDFAIEGNNIRFGLNSIKGISEKTLEGIKKFREPSPTKYDIFITAKQAGINIGVLSALIQAGTLSSYRTRRSRLVLEAQTFNSLTDGEKKSIIALGPKYNYDILTCIAEGVFKNKEINEKGKPIMSEKRKITFKEKYDQYKKIYEKNKDKEAFSNWYFERKLLGYSPSGMLKDVFNADINNLQSILEINGTLSGEYVKFVGVVSEVFNGKTKEKKKEYYKFIINDETGAITCMFMDSPKYKRLTDHIESKLPIPEKESIVVITGKKGDDCIWVEGLSVLDEKIYMKLSDVE